MRAYHHTRQAAYRSPGGAVKTGGAVSLALDLFDAEGAECLCRLWVDGRGEELLPMEAKPIEGGLRFSCTVTPRQPALLWYSFIIHQSGAVHRYGAAEGRVGGEGRLYGWEPPSFQITVYQERTVPEWFKNGIVYQIFPDRFARGAGDPARAKQALSAPRRGPERALCEDWYARPRYEKDAQGRVQRWDFYGGSLSGISEKLRYLKELGVTTLYLNPVFEAASNHRYDTADYLQIDPLLGEGSDFAALCAAAAEQGLSIILDGSFNHTGQDSRYFNKLGNYPDVGAYQSEHSPYRPWFHIQDGAYKSWWGVDDLPEVDKNCPGYREFIYGGRESVVRHWLREGARGWRLDVADELPDDFIAGLKRAALETREDSVLIGEVWEDASHKISYGKLRRYLLGEELDSVMNYPLRAAMLDFITGHAPASELCEALEALQENYPPEAFYAALNLMGSHDRPRLMTLLGGAPPAESMSEEARAADPLTAEQRALAKGRLWLVTLCQMALPGVPCVYYGDEAGLEGDSDPGNRGGFPWGREDADAQNIYRNAISLRKALPLLTDGSFAPFYQGEDVFGFTRCAETGERAVILINRSSHQAHTVSVPACGQCCAELIGGQAPRDCGDTLELTLPRLGSAVLYFSESSRIGKPLEPGAGVLCHVTSLPKARGAGTLGKPAKALIDTLHASSQRYWQLLPLNPTDEHGSPYAGVSAFAGNPALLNIGKTAWKKRFEEFVPGEDFHRFCERNQAWLDKYAAFMALQSKFSGKPWQSWPKAYRTYSPKLLKKPALAEQIRFYQFEQYEFFRQWAELRAYARNKDVLLIGDLPMYVSGDSADVWAEPEQFRLDAAGHAREVAGVPPDYFAKEGQLWGNPLYDWDAMKQDGYAWWLRRLEQAFELYDYVRLDHFRGFESYWAVPAGEKAAQGRWLYGPGLEFFRLAAQRFGQLPVLAEDLGSITPGVRALVAACGFTGMDVLQFYDRDPREGYAPPRGKAVYTGTHDNQTLLGWCAERYFGEPTEEIAEELLSRVIESGAEVMILPLQDVLKLGDAARMNTPGTVGGNWLWQAEKEMLALAEKNLNGLRARWERSRYGTV